MTNLAFKIAAKAGGPISKGIAAVTHGPYSHVELWLGGPQQFALCYSSREPVGTGFANIDLTDGSLWRVIPVTISLQLESPLMWFCMGSQGRPYNFKGIEGIALDTDQHNESERFCSEACFEALQAVTGWWPRIKRWHVAPSGFGKDDRYGLYELVTAMAEPKAA